MQLDLDQISRIAREIAAKQIGKARIESVIPRTGIDSLGNDALLITLVVKADFAAKMTGERALNFLVEFQKRLEMEGDSRFPIVEYATEAELEEDEVEHA